MNLVNVQGEIKAIVEECTGTPTAKLIAILAAAGISKASEVASLIGISERAIRKAKAEPQFRNHSSGKGTTGQGEELQDRNHSSESGTTVPDSASRVIDNNKLTNLVDSLEINIPPTPKRKRSTSKSEALEAFNAYNETALRCGLPQAAKFTPNRERAIAARLKDYGLDGWKRALANIEKSAFLTGGTDHGFRADLDFVCQAKSFGKLHDGGYGNGRHTEQPKQPQEFDWSQGPAWWRETYERMRGAN